MATPVRSDRDHGNAARILNLPDAVDPQEPATLAQVNSAVENLKDKGVALVRTTSNVNLASPGATLDGETMEVGDVFLADGQTDPAENGLYTWNGAATPATRSANASTGPELVNAVVKVIAGTDAGTTFRQTAGPITLGTTAIDWVTFGGNAPAASTSTPGIAALATQSEVNAGVVTNKIVTPETLNAWSGRRKKHTALIGDGSATQYDVTHNFDEEDVDVVVRRVSDGAEVEVEWRALDANTVRINFSTGAAPTSNQYSVTVRD